jgi:hypothetical protein
MRRFLSLLLPLFVAVNALAQTAPVETVVGSRAVVDSTYRYVPQIDARYVLQPRRPENPFPIPEMGRSEGNSLHVTPMGATRHGRVEARFPGIGATGWEPPDSVMAVGPGHVIINVNSSWAIFNKNTGEKTFQQTFETFFAGVAVSNFLFDPKCFYDHISKRYVMIVLELDTGQQISKVLLAISDDDDPNGNWFKYRLEAARVINGTNTWLDYPGAGYSRDSFLFTGNNFGFSSGFQGIQFLHVRKSSVLNGGNSVVDYFVDTSTFTAQVGESFDNNDRLYAMSRQNSTTMKIWAIQDPLTNPTIVSKTVPIPTHSQPNQNAPSPGGRLLDTMAAQLMKAAYRDGKLVTSHTIGVTGDNRARVRWYEFDTNNWPVDPNANPTLVQTGDIVGGENEHLFCATVNKNMLGDVVAVFTRSSPNIVADIMVSTRKQSDPAGEMGAPQLLESSEGAMYGSTGFNRWGDYSDVCVDPVDDATFWVLHMNAAADGNWKTSFFKVVVTEPTLLGTLTVNPNTIVGGSTTIGRVTLAKPSAPGGTVVTLTSQSSAIRVPSSVTIPEGGTGANFQIITDVVGQVSVRQISANILNHVRTTSVTLLPGLASFTVNPTQVVGGGTTTGTVRLFGNAPSGGLTVGLFSRSAAISVPQSVVVPGGQTTATFQIRTHEVGFTAQREVQAVLGSITRSAVITLTPSLRSFTVNPTTVVGGNPITGTVTLHAPAPAGGTVVTLSSGSGAIIVPNSVMIPAGQTTATFQIQTTGVVGGPYERFVFATAGVTRAAKITIRAN